MSLCFRNQDFAQIRDRLLAGGFAANPMGMGGDWLNRFHLFCVLLAHGKKCTQARVTALPWGVFAGTWFLHTPTGAT